MAQFAHHPLAIPFVPQAGPNEYSMIENQLAYKFSLVCTDFRKVKSIIYLPHKLCLKAYYKYNLFTKKKIRCEWMNGNMN